MYGCASACSTVMRLPGLNCSMRAMRSSARGCAPGNFAPQSTACIRSSSNVLCCSTYAAKRASWLTLLWGLITEGAACRGVCRIQATWQDSTDAVLPPPWKVEVVPAVHLGCCRSHLQIDNWQRAALVKNSAAGLRGTQGHPRAVPCSADHVQGDDLHVYHGSSQGLDAPGLPACARTRVPWSWR